MLAAALRADPEAGNLRFPATPPFEVRDTLFRSQYPYLIDAMR